MHWERIDKSDGASERVTDDEAFRAAENYHHDVNMALAAGRFQTPFSIYQRIEEAPESGG